MNQQVVEAIGLSYAYPDGTTALDGASFRVAPGESVRLTGIATVFRVEEIGA